MQTKTKEEKEMKNDAWITQRNMLGLVLGAENIKIHETRSLLTHIMKRPTCQVTIIAL